MAQLWEMKKVSVLEVGCWDVQQREGAECLEGSVKEIVIALGGLRLGENFTCMSAVLTENCVLQCSVLRVDVGVTEYWTWE